MKFGRRAIISGVIVGLLLLLVGGRAIAGFLVELYWYRSLQLENVFWTHWRAALLVRGTAALLTALAVFANLWFVARSLGTIRVRRRYANIEIAERLPQMYVVGALGILSLFSAWWLSSGLADPLPILAALNPDSFGLADPVFGRDASFYVFQLPVLSRIQTLASLLVFWIALLATAAYVSTGAIRVVEGKLTVSALARRHLGVLVAAFLLFYAFNVWLDRYHLLVSGNGFEGALGYTDVHARIPAKLIVLVLTLAAAAAIGYGSWRGAPRLPVAAAILLFVGLVSAEVIYPSSIQRFVVEPNQFPREEGFIQQHLEFTRAAYDLATVERVPLPYDTRAEIDEAALLERLSGVPLWDPRPLLTTYQQQQALFRYYSFGSVHHDRYGPEGAQEPVAISVRELETTELEAAAQTWQNLHLNYVSGEGAVVSPVATMAADGTPEFYVWDIDPPKVDPAAPAELALENPSVYFGERTREYVILGPQTEPIGISISGAMRQLLFAWAFQSKNILLSGELGDDSKIVFRRVVSERVMAAAPFLRVTAERSAYPVIDAGRILWVVDAYTTSDNFPLSRRSAFDSRPVRYVRNSVKATVDAVTGEVRLYRVDENDPILDTYSRIFPDLIRPGEEMPEALRAHLRFPIQLMLVQAQVMGSYHLQDPRAFYGQEDVWSVATEQYRGTPASMEPTYSMYPLPGSSESEFLLSVPYVARGRQNMTALLVTRNDAPNYGQQILYLLPRDELIQGPQQIEAMIDQDPEISQQLSLWRRGGSDVIRGHLMIVPVEGSLVYVEPLFLEAANAAIPQLERVILAGSGRVVMEPTFTSAVAALLRGQSGPPADSGAVSTPLPGPIAGESESMQRARTLMSQAEALLRAGDWAGFGQTWEELQETLTPGAATN